MNRTSQSSSQSITREERYQQTQRVTLISVIANILLAVLKIVFGFVSHSQALIADGIHSLSDLLSDALVYVAAWHAKEAPDAEHPYGHGRYETAATLGLGIILLLVGAGIIWDAGHRLFFPEQLLQPTLLALYVAALSILVKEALYHYTLNVAKKIRSDMLRANAWHHRSDSVSSIVVLIGVGGTLVGLPYLDAIAAVGVGLMIIHIGWELGWPAVQELVDVGLEEDRLAAIRETILSVSGVRSIHMLRTRRLGDQASADVHVLVEPWLSVSEGHMISETVQYRLIHEIEEIGDVTVHIDPEDDESGPPCRGLPLRSDVQAILNEKWHNLLNLKTKRMVLHYLAGAIDIDLYLPLTDEQTVAQTTALRQSLENALKNDPRFRRVQLFFCSDPF